MLRTLVKYVTEKLLAGALSHKTKETASALRDFFYILLLYIKTGVYRGIQFFLLLIQNIDCGYSLEKPQRGGSNVYSQSMF